MRILQYQDYWQMGSDDFQDGDVIVAKVALVLGTDKDYAVYVAYREDMAADDVANIGDKVDFPNMFSTATYGRYQRK